MIRRVLNGALGYRSLAQYAIVGLKYPQDQVQVSLVGGGLPELDVTRCNVVVSLRPFLIGVSLPEGERRTSSVHHQRELVFRESGILRHGRELGRIGLLPLREIPLDGTRLCVFGVGTHRDHCLEWPRLATYYARQWWHAWTNQKPGNFKMAFGDLIRIWTFYICPRPVMLVTVVHGSSSNIFPMDLVGFTGSPYFSLALRSTSPSVKLIAESRRIAVSRVPIGLSAPVYELGKHHRLSSIDWGTLPFATDVSSVFQLPVPTAALGVQELEIEQVHTIGSHTLFLGKPVSAQDVADGLGMFHISGLYSEYLRRQAGTQAPGTLDAA